MDGRAPAAPLSHPYGVRRAATGTRTGSGSPTTERPLAMNESYNATLTLWPATPLPANVAHELHELGVNLSTFTVNDGWLTTSRTGQDTLVLALSFGRRRCGLTDLEAVLATLRLAGISYLAWHIKQGEVAGTGRSFDPATRIERQFTVMADGEPVLTANDLEEFEGRHGTGEALIEDIREWLRLPIPDSLTELSLEELAIVIAPEEEDEDESVEIVGDVDGPPGACLCVGHEGSR